MKQCAVILHHVASGNHIRIACPQCKTNINSKGDFISGVDGMLQHLQNAHDITPTLLPGETNEHYIERTCKVEDLSNKDIAQIRKGHLTIPRRFPDTDTDRPPRRLTYEEVPEHTHIVQFFYDGVREAFHRKLYCAECECDAPNNKKFFDGVNGFADHMRGHGIEIGKGEEEAIYVYQNCPYKQFSAQDVINIIDNGMEKKVVRKEKRRKGQDRKRKRDEMEEEDGEVVAGELQAPPLKQLALRPKQADS